MNVRFAEVDENYIKSKVDEGFYVNETELVRDAVRHMREEEERRQRFAKAVSLGEEQIKRGEGRAYSDELMDQIEKRAIEKAEHGQPIHHPDVIPK